MDNTKPKLYTKAPLSFIGQKRNFLKAFRQVIANNIHSDGAGWTIIDVFGGSGLLANNAKHLLPKAHVIYNDFDGYVERLEHMTDTERLRQIVANGIKESIRGKGLTNADAQCVKQLIMNFDGYIDVQCIATWLLFSGKQVKTLDELFASKLYYSVRVTPYTESSGYLTGIEIINQSYIDLMSIYIDKPKTLLLLDPPYLYTGQGAYKQDNYFAMIDFLKLMSRTRPPYIFFSSTKSELLDYMGYLEQLDGEDWRRLGGYDKVTIQARLNNKVSYEDNMIYKFD